MTKPAGKRAGRLAGLAGLLCASLPLVSAGQAEAPEPTPPGDDAVEPVEEIVVTAEKPGDRKSVDTPYEELMRQRLLEEMDTMRREQEEIAWRRGPTVSQPSRLNFGYRPQDRGRDSRDSTLTDLPIENTKPATIFRFEF